MAEYLTTVYFNLGSYDTIHNWSPKNRQSLMEEVVFPIVPSKKWRFTPCTLSESVRYEAIIDNVDLNRIMKNLAKWDLTKPTFAMSITSKDPKNGFYLDPDDKTVRDFNH